MTGRLRIARWLWVAPGLAVAAYAVVEPPRVTVLTGTTAMFVLVVTAHFLKRPRASALELERGISLDLDELAVVALALVADPLLVGFLFSAMSVIRPSQKLYRTAYTGTMRALVGLGAALAAQPVLTASTDSEPVRYLLLLAAAAVAHVVLAVGSGIGVMVAIWVESGQLHEDWHLATSADVALAAMSVPLGALGADLLERAPYGAFLLGVVVVGAASVLRRLLIAEIAVREEQHRRDSLLGRLAELSATERRTLVRQVHDGPLQQLILTRMLLEQNRSSAVPNMPLDIDEVDNELGKSIADLRQVLSGSSSSLVIHGLGQAVESLVDSTMVPDSTTIRVLDSLPPGFGASDTAGSGAAQVALDCIRELMTNALKHARASEVRIEMGIRDDQLVACVIDDGDGFDPETILPQREQEGHLGLPLVNERLERAGGRIVLTSRPGEGTTGACTVPLHPHERAGRW